MSTLFYTFVTPAPNDDRILLLDLWNRLHGGSWHFENKHSYQVVVYCCSAI